MAIPRFIPSYTVEDYRLWEGQWELWSGVPVAMSPSSGRAHQRLGLKLLDLFSSELKRVGCADCELLYEIDWIAAQDTVFRPDLVITCDGQETPHLATPPVLAVEILSPSTRSRDLLYKREAYETLGVRYYLIADPDSRTLNLLELRGGRYDQSKAPELRLHEGCVISPNFQTLFQD